MWLERSTNIMNSLDRRTRIFGTDAPSTFLIVIEREDRISMKALFRENALKRGFPMVEERDMPSLEREKEYLNRINTKPYFWQRRKRVIPVISKI